MFPTWKRILPRLREFLVSWLVIFGIPLGQGSWANNITDPKVREAAEAYSAALSFDGKAGEGA